MKKNFKQSVLTDFGLAPLTFKTAIPQGRELAKGLHYEQPDGVVSNSLTRSTNPPQFEKESRLAAYEESEGLGDENAINFQQVEKNQKAPSSHFEDPSEGEESGLCTKPYPVKIMVDNFDDSITRNPKLKRQEALAQEIKKQNPQQNTINKEKKRKKAPPAPTAAPLINPTEGESSRAKVDKILQSSSLREKYGHLLIGDEKYSIGHKHTRLLKIMEAIDNTISFIGANRREKFMFFNDLQRSLKDHNNSMEVREDHLQQLIFIDDTLYLLEWVTNKNQRYALRLKLPDIPSFDKRRTEVRKKIVDYLLTLEAEYAAAKNIPKLTIGQWSSGFDPQDYDIPRKSLPTHPNCKGADIKQLTEKQIDAVDNPNLRNFMKSRKRQQDQKSLNSQQVSNMILMKNFKAKTIVQKAIKEKEEQVALMLQSQGQEKLQKKVVLDICTEMVMMYMAANTSYMFRDTVQCSLNRKLRYKEGKIMQSLRFILQAKEVGFLNEVQTSERPVLRMDRGKFDEMRRKIDKLQ